MNFCRPTFWARHKLKGIEPRDNPIALTLIRELGHRADYLAQPHTLKWFAEELYTPSAVIDRGTLDGWKRKGSKSTWERAQDRVDELLATYQGSSISKEIRAELREIATHAAKKFGMDELPPLSLD